MSEKVRAHVKVSGRVQGVCYRMEAEEKARALGVSGWVRNTDEGKVEAVFEGEPERVQKMIEWCHHGPTAARVTEVSVQWEPYRGDMSDFRTAR